MNLAKYIVLGSTLFLVGCTAATIQYVPLPQQAHAIDDPNKARIYVVRSKEYGSWVSGLVKDGDTVIGKIGPKGFLSWERAPGKTTLTIQADNLSPMPLTAVAGQVYYFEEHTNPWLISGRVNLEKISNEEGMKRVAECDAPYLSVEVK